MATADIATLGIRVDARQVREADQALDRLGQTGQNTERRVDGTSAAMQRLERMAARVAAALSVAKIIEMADAWANLQGRLSLVADGQERLAQTTDALFKLAQRTRTGLVETAALYGKITTSTQALNRTDAERLRVTESINKALIVSGASGSSAAAALMQLGQAFGANRLGGEELNSILEQTPRLARAIAEGMGKTVGDLKALAEAGKLTSETVFRALESQAGQLDAEFAKMPTTVAQAMTTVENALLRAVGVFDQQNQLSAGLAKGIVAVADNMDTLAKVVVVLTGLKFINWIQGAADALLVKVGALNASIIAERAAHVSSVALAEAAVAQAAADHVAALGATERAAALGRLAIAQEGLAAAQAAAGASAGVGALALAALGGPMGLLTLALGAGAVAWSIWGNSAKDAQDKAREGMPRTTQQIIDGLNEQTNKLLKRAELAKAAGMKGIAQGGGEAADKLADTLAEIQTLQQAVAAGSATDFQRGQLEMLQRDYVNLKTAIDAAAGAQAKVTAGDSAEKFAQWMQKHSEYMDKAGKIKAAIADAKKEMGDAAYEANREKVDKMIRASFDKGDVDKAKSAYQELVSSIRAKIDEQQLELAVGRNATDAQKQQIKFDEELRSGKLKLAPTQRAEVQTLLDKFAATEKVNAAAATQRDITRQIAEANLSRAEAAAGLDVEYRNYGKIADARELDMIAVRAQFDMERKLQGLQVDGKEISDQVRNQLLAERDTRTLVEQSIMRQAKALQYADQLRQQNQQFAIDYLPNDKAKAAAQLAVDKALWQSRISLAEEGSEARKKLEAEYVIWEQNQVLKPQLDAQIKLWDSIEQTAHDTFISIMDGGKSMAERLRETLKNTLFDWLYQMTLKKWIIDVRAQMTGGAPALTGGTGDVFAQAASASGNPLIQAVGAASSMYKAVSGGLSSIGGTMASGMGQGVTMLGQQFGSEALTTFGKGMQGFGADGSLGGLSGLGQQAGAVIGKIGGAVAGYMIGSTLNSAISGKYETGSGVMKVEKVATAVAAYINPIAGAVVGAFSGLVNRAFGMGPTELKASGLRGTLSSSGASGETYQQMHQDGGWFRSDKNWTDAQQITTAMQAQLTQAFEQIKFASGSFANTLGLGTDALAGYSKAFDIAFTKDAAANEKAIADFFASMGDEIANKLVPGLDKFSRTGESSSATLERLAAEFDATTAAAQNLGKSAAEMFGSVGMESAAARDRLVMLAGGTDALVQISGSFAQNFLSDAERLAPVSKALDAALGSLGLSTIPTTIEAYKNLVQSIDPTTEAGGKLLVSLLQLSDAFYQVHKASEQTAAALGEQLDAAYAVLDRAVNAQKSQLKSGYDAAAKQLGKVLTGAKDSVSKLTTLANTLRGAVTKAAGVNVSRATAQAQIQTALALARASGKLPNVDAIKDALDVVGQDSAGMFSTFEEYQRDRLTTAIAVSNLADMADGQLSEAEQQVAMLENVRDALEAAYNAEVSRLDGLLETAQRQIDAVKGVDVSVQSVSAALGALMSLIGGNTTAGIVGAYGNALGRAPDAGGLAYWQNAAAGGTSMADITKGIASSAEAADRIEKLYETVLGRQGDAAGMAYWLEQLGKGTSLGQIESTFRSSDEYRANTMSTGSAAAPAVEIDAAAIAKAVNDAMFPTLYQIAKNTGRAATSAENTNRQAEEKA